MKMASQDRLDAIGIHEMCHPLITTFLIHDRKGLLVNGSRRKSDERPFELPSELMPTEQILAVSIAERDKLNPAIEAAWNKQQACSSRRQCHCNA